MGGTKYYQDEGKIFGVTAIAWGAPYTPCSSIFCPYVYNKISFATM